MSLSLNLIKKIKTRIGGEVVFMLSAMIVNAGNYYYNLFLGRAVGPEVFAETGLIVTFLLILSFLGMTLQLVAAKYIVDLEGGDSRDFQGALTKLSLLLGVILAIILWQSADALGAFFNLESSDIIPTFAIGITAYFYLSTMRGLLQGQQQFEKLALSYQVEMIARFAISILLIFGFDLSAPISVSFAVSASIILGALVCGKPVLDTTTFKLTNSKAILTFLLFTLGYEVVQMVINYCDVLLVKHYFDATSAGQYTSLSLIGRMVYFVTWMFVMLLLPKVLNARKVGTPYEHLLGQYLAVIGLFVVVAVTGCYLFSEELVLLMFGAEYLAISALLWKYALATGLFALGNIFTYYYLSLENYKPIGITASFAALMMLILTLAHQSLELIVTVQVICMGAALLAQLVYHKYNTTYYRIQLSTYRRPATTDRKINNAVA